MTEQPSIAAIRAALDEAVSAAKFTPSGAVVLPMTEWMRLVGLFIPNPPWPSEVAESEQP